MAQKDSSISNNSKNLARKTIAHPSGGIQSTNNAATRKTLLSNNPIMDTLT